MNKKLKKVLLATVALSAVSLSAVPTFAKSLRYYEYFYISANGSYGQRGGGNPKRDYADIGYINWTGGDTKWDDGYNEIFRVVNSNGDVRSQERRLSFLGSGAIKEYSSVTYDYYYYLQARRENWWDPMTSVWGDWEA